MAEADNEALDMHAFMILTGGTLRDYSMCGLKLGAMHRWRKPENETQCHLCKRALSKGGRA